MTPPPLPLRVRDATDYAQQIAFHRCNALAKALLDSSLLPRTSPPQSVPYSSPRTSAVGSDLAARLEQTKAAYIAAEQDSRAPGLPWEEAEKRTTHAARLLYRAHRLQAELDALPASSRSVRPGVPGYYVVPVSAAHVTGWVEVVTPPQTWHLDTRHLSGEIRGRIDAWLLGPANHKPFRYKRGPRRYYPRDGVPDDLRSLTLTLNGCMVPAEPLKVAEIPV